MASKKPQQPIKHQFTLFHLQPQHAGLTLASALKGLMNECTWGQVQQFIQQRQVQVNGNLCLDQARRVAEKDVIKLWQQPLPKPVTADQLRIPYLDEHIVVVEKPAGITSVWHREERRMPARRRQLQPTLEEMLPIALAKEIGHPRESTSRAKTGGRPVKGRRPTHVPPHPDLRWPVYPVHRLDRDTSGLMLFARTRLAEQKLVIMFRDRHIERRYWAVAHGRVSSQTVRSILVRDRGDGLRGSILPNAGSDPLEGPLQDLERRGEKAFESELEDSTAEGQSATTHVEYVESIGPYSIIRCRLETGRTHQIRIHLSELGHPLCGDKIYIRMRGGQTLSDASGAPRQALHAERLAFTHPFTSERLDFHMPLPLDLKRWLSRVRSELGSNKGHGDEKL